MVKENSKQLVVEVKIDSLGDTDSTEFSVDVEDEWIIFQSFINYSDPIGSLVREIASNAYDANIEANSKRNVEIQMHEDNSFSGTSEFVSFRDFGFGMDPDTIKKIYSKFGKSTKRKRMDLIGAYGFGAKSPLAYQDMYDLITITDGVKYHYNVHKGEKKPIISLLYKEETEEPSGTEVRINIKKYDRSAFISAIKSGLKYFNNINYINCDIPNEYYIVKGKNFIHKAHVSSHNPHKKHSGTVHLCIGKVYYPINFDKLNFHTSYTDRIQDFALYFDIGEIPVVWNRENVEYTSEAIELIKEKYDLAFEELQNLYDKKYKSINSIDELMAHSDGEGTIDLGKVTTLAGEEEVLRMPITSSKIKTSISYPKYKHIKVTYKNSRYHSSFFDIYRVHSKIDSYRHVKTISKLMEDKDRTLFLLMPGEQLSDLQRSYISDNYDAYILRKPSRKNALRSYISQFSSYDLISRPYTIEKVKRQAIITDIHNFIDEVMEYVESNTQKISDLVIPTKYSLTYYEKQKELKKKRKERFLYSIVSRFSSFTRRTAEVVHTKSIFGKNIVIFGNQIDREELIRKASFVYDELGRTNVHIIQVSMANGKRLRQELPDTSFHVSEFDQIPFIARLPRTHRKDHYKKYLYENYPLARQTFDSSVLHRVHSSIKEYMPSIEEKDKILALMGEKLKYPLLPYTYNLPADLEKEYKEDCRYNHINPILMAKLYIKKYDENKRTEDQQ